MSYQKLYVVFCYKTGITTDGRKNLVIGTGPQTLPPPVAVEALPLLVQQSIEHL